MRSLFTNAFAGFDFGDSKQQNSDDESTNLNDSFESLDESAGNSLADSVEGSADVHNSGVNAEVDSDAQREVRRDAQREVQAALAESSESEDSRE